MRVCVLRYGQENHPAPDDRVCRFFGTAFVRSDHDLRDGRLRGTVMEGKRKRNVPVRGIYKPKMRDREAV